MKRAMLFLAVVIGLLMTLFSVPASAQAPFSWTRVAQCLPDMRSAPVELSCTAGGASTTVPQGRYVLLVTVGTAHIRQGQATCSANDAPWVDGTQVPVDEGAGGPWCCQSSDAAKAQLVRCK